MQHGTTVATDTATATSPMSAVAEGADLHELYAQMYLIRRTEQTFLDLYGQGLLSGTVHTSIGQEASAVGVVAALNTEIDVLFSSHRAHGHFIAYCNDVEGLVAEILGKPTGICGGIGGTQHLHAGNMYTNGIQGGIVPSAVGAALAEKLKGSGAISVVFLGDGTMAQGTVYEGMNLTSLWNLPLLFVLEDNGIAQTTPKHLQHAGRLTTRGESFGIESAWVNANDVLAVREDAAKAVDYVRSNSRPFFLHVQTYRLGPHSKGDDTRSPEEMAECVANDPLPRLAAQLDTKELQAIEGEIEERIKQAVQDAINAEAQVLSEGMGGKE